MSTIFEIVHFGFRPEVSVADQQQQLARVARWARAQPGFVSRRLFHDTDRRRWVDVVEWRDRLAAQEAFARFSAEPSLQDVAASLDGGSVTAGHYDETATD